MAIVEGGYILLSRKIIESDIWEKPPIYLKVWMYILTKAQHKPYKNLERGELLVSIPELIEVCSYKVGYRTEKPSKTQIFNVLEWLRSSDEGSHEDDAKEPMIETTKTTRGMVVKVLNYNVYQDPKVYERNDANNDEDATNGTMPERQADTINKNGKNEKNVKKDKPSADYDSEFEEFYKIYKKKGDKKRAFSKFKIARRTYSLETILQGTRKYMKQCEINQTNKQYIKGAAVFLHGENFNDEYELTSSKSSSVIKPSNSVDAGDLLEGMEWN